MTMPVIGPAPSAFTETQYELKLQFASMMSDTSNSQ